MNENNLINGVHDRRSALPNRRLRRGFTLLELVIVIGVILVLMGLVLGVGSIVVGQSETRQLNATMTIVDAALSEFENQTGRPLVFEGASTQTRYDHCGYPAVEYDFGGNPPPEFGVYYDVPFNPFLDERFTDSLEDGGFGWVDMAGICAPWEADLGEVRRQWLAATLSVLAQDQTCADMIAKADPTLVHAAQCVVGGTTEGARFQVLNQIEFIDPWQQQVYLVFPGRPFVDRDAEDDNIRDADGTIRTLEEVTYGICRNQRPLLVSAGPDSRFGRLQDDIDDQDYADAQDNIYSYEPAQP
jgi:prepilin-type N-terminal cleavage/methylation domain-containing protein